MYAGDASTAAAARGAAPAARSFCTREYVPVCARRGDDRQTFPNECVAEEAGFRVISDGEC